MVYLHLVAWEGVGEDTERSYSACLREISQNASREKKHATSEFKLTLLFELSGFKNPSKRVSK
jgi:hypothetical protein